MAAAKPVDYGRAINVLADEAVEEKGEMARLTTFIGAMALSDLVKTTLGPKGMDKILLNKQHNEIQVTNDGATILKSVPLANPSAKVLVDIARTQDDEVGDGTTSVVVLAGELLREGEGLLARGLHPQVVIEGWREASNIAKKEMFGASVNNAQDDPKQFEQDLLNIARTTISSKILNTNKEQFARLAVDAVLRLKGSTDLGAIHIIKKSGAKLADSFLVDGLLLEKSFGVGQPKRIENPRVLIANTAMDADKIKIFGATVRVNDISSVAAIEEAERHRMFAKCEKILAHQCNLFVNRQLIYNLSEQYFADKGISSIEHADFDGIERLALVLGGDIVSTFEQPDKVKLGTCKLVEEVTIGQESLIKFSGCPLTGACTIVLRGATDSVLDEAERSLHDALCVLTQTVKSERVVLGGGCIEMIMAKAVDEQAERTSGKKSLAMAAFARALRRIPYILAENGGYDSTELVTQLKAAHNKGEKTMGLNMATGSVGDMAQLGVVESYKVKEQVILSASEASEMIMRVDEVLKAAPRRREQDPRHH
mmetsp:Transcript_10746/g.16099  ORF Transcript_10746/g.16099 Transcript_10746/m.16099 type:complete len:540 (+) Transcript_10746:1303-2922(+)